ncbi:histidine--tRNA ligase [Chloropicon primus]|uniref:histidine--tRNA ligase n=1 Tax=Chloropicon primus TaxID=1764295 RepID=A0A5B8MEM9_9CHLO|nr:histidine--tRNA ligase [Chloropicon primus]|eukprot:QDZ18903.1 histidine--tRNA ligase [Chloropicon primus]
MRAFWTTRGRLSPLPHKASSSSSSSSCVPRVPRLRRGAASGDAGGTASASASASKGKEQRRSAGELKKGSSPRQLIDLQPPRGTRDFFPEEMRLRNWLFDKFRHVSWVYGFEEVDFPVLESEQLYTRKAGEEITTQLYNFEDKGGRRVSLRPELTPSLSRLVLQKGKSLQLPTKWFAIGQCWRYERTTRGRRREHYQWNMDIVGVSSMEAEAEVISAIIDLFKLVGLSSQDVYIKISNRKLLQSLISTFGVSSEVFPQVCVCVDKLGKIPREAICKELVDLGLSAEVSDRIVGLVAEGTFEDYKRALVEGGSDESNLEVLKEIEGLLDILAARGYEDWIQFDGSIVRGLAYYSGTVFEAFDRDGELRAICGGGRYDHLLSTFGGKDQPMVGFGFGDAVIVELLKQKNLLPQLSPQIDDIVVSLDPALQKYTGQVASKLRSSGRRVDVVLEQKKMKWVFKQGDRTNARRLVILGQEEWERGVVKVRDLAEREEREVPIDDLV